MRHELQININPTQSAQGKFPFFSLLRTSRTKAGKALEMAAPEKEPAARAHTHRVQTELREPNTPSRLKFLGGIIQEDWILLAPCCAELLQLPALPASTKPALFPAEFQFLLEMLGKNFKFLFGVMPVHAPLQPSPSSHSLRGSAGVRAELTENRNVSQTPPGSAAGRPCRCF